MPCIDSNIEDGLLLLYEHGNFTVWIVFFPIVEVIMWTKTEEENMEISLISEKVRQIPQIIAVIAQSYCVILPEKAQLDPNVAETKNCEYWGWPTRSHKARPRGLRRTSAPLLAVESDRTIEKWGSAPQNGGQISTNTWVKQHKFGFDHELFGLSQSMDYFDLFCERLHNL